MNIDPSTTKYMIESQLTTEGIVEKPDVVGAIFGQTEGLLGDELDLRDLQKTGRMGRIEVEISGKKGKSEGKITIPSSLDKVETVILAAALESIDRVGPCKANIKISKITDVRLTKKRQIQERAKELLAELMKSAKGMELNLTDTVRQAIQVEELVHFGTDKCPAGPHINTSEAIIIVEGRSDILNLLKYGIKNAIAVEGTNVPKTIQELSKERIVTAFVDGDRGGELILKELFQVTEVDFVAQAPKGREVEELTQKQIVKSLRNKIPAEQFLSLKNNDIFVDKKAPAPSTKTSNDAPKPREIPKTKPEPVPAKPEKKLSDIQQKYKDILVANSSSSKAFFLDEKGNILEETTVRKLATSMKEIKKCNSLVFDGIVTQRILDNAEEAKIPTIVAVKVGNVTKVPKNVKILTQSDLS